MSEKVCRLCLRTISNNHYHTLEESMLKALRLNLKLSAETVMCFECAGCLQAFSKFTPGSVNVADETLTLSVPQNDVKLDLVQIEAASNLESLMETDTKCNFCAETRGSEHLIPLNESKENKFLVNTLQQYIWDMNLKNTEELLTCITCFEALQGVLSFILKCLDVEETISKYIELKGTDDNGQIELKDVQQFMYSPILEIESVDVSELDRRCVQIKEEYTTVTEGKMKYEKEISHSELIVKTEDDIKSEQSDCDGFQESRIPDDSLHKLVVISEEKKCKEKTFHCETCSYMTKHDGYWRRHLLTHQRPDMYKCELCLYETKHKYALERHLLSHKSLSEINTFKCDFCSYEAKHKSHFNVHLLIHKNPSEIKMFKCDLCSYETKYKSHLKVHLLKHKWPSEIKMFKCELCSYEAKCKASLKTHLLIHKSPSEIEMFKCNLCSYEAKQKSTLIQHLLTHKSPSEIKMFKCELCSYAAKRHSNLIQHLLTHKSPSEVKIFKCALCAYEAKQKSHLRAHLLTHMDPSKIKMFRCDLCSYGAKHKHHLERHLLTHKSLSLK